jgi:shikimate kinase
VDDLFLCGLKHSGKTYIGRYLAVRWGWKWIDADDLTKMGIPEGMTIRSFYKAQGVATFQNVERTQMSAFLSVSHPRTVVSMGGGAADNQGLLELCRLYGALVYLYVPEDVLFSRILADGLPPFLDPDDPKESFHRLFLRRNALYGKACQIVLHLPDSPTVQQTAAWCGERLEGYKDGTQQFRI